MKFCPNCGFPLEGKKICSCGYNVDSNEVDEKIYEEYKNKEKYEKQCDNLTSPFIYGMMTKEQYIENVRKMGVDSSITDEEIIAQINRPIFNKEPDFINGEEILKNRIIEKNKDE